MLALSKLILRVYTHVAGERFRSGRGWCENFAENGYRLTIAFLDLYPQAAPDEDPVESVAFRLASSVPFEDRHGVLAFIATLPGIRRVRESNFIGTAERPIPWRLLRGKG